MSIAFSRSRRRGGAGGRAALLAGAVVTATALAAGTALPGSVPSARAVTITQDLIGTGTLVWAADKLGLLPPSITIAVPGVSGLDIQLNLSYTDSDPVNLNFTINSIPFPSQTPRASQSRNAAVLATGGASVDLMKAYRALIESAQGNTPEGYSALVPNPASLPIVGRQINQTNEAFILVRDPLRPNGGFNTRFAKYFNFFGIDTTLPPAGVPSGQVPGIKLNTGILDVTYAYDPMSDFPETGNVFSLLNTALALLPTNLLGGGSLAGDPIEDIGLNLGTLLQLGLLAPNGRQWYATYVPDNLPLLEPLRLPARLFNLAAGALGWSIRLGTPLVDALEPAAKILVNIGYTDVVTPDDLAADPSLAAQNFQPYDRTFQTSGVPTQFFSTLPLTFDEWLQVPGAVLKALWTGFSTAFQKIIAGGAWIQHVTPEDPAPTATAATFSEPAAPAADKPPTPTTEAADNSSKPDATPNDDPSGSSTAAGDGTRTRDSSRTASARKVGPAGTGGSNSAATADDDTPADNAPADNAPSAGSTPDNHSAGGAHKRGSAAKRGPVRAAG